ncbi:MoaD/ThiS family protein [Verrucomicrobiota bacterium sgz303538]
MQVRLLVFAQAADTAGFRERTVECNPSDTLRSLVAREVPQLALTSLRVAIDCEYQDWDHPIGTAQEIALIPPVSGG